MKQDMEYFWSLNYGWTDLEFLYPCFSFPPSSTPEFLVSITEVILNQLLALFSWHSAWIIQKMFKCHPLGLPYGIMEKQILIRNIWVFTGINSRTGMKVEVRKNTFSLLKLSSSFIRGIDIDQYIQLFFEECFLN